MIFSKANLHVIWAASKEAFARALNGVKFEKDGSTVAGNGRIMMAVGPVKREVSFPETGGELLPLGEDGVVMPIKAVETALKNMPRDKRPALQHIALTSVTDASRVGFTSVDGKGDPITNASLPRSERFPDWKDTMRTVRGSGEGLKICVNIKDLIELLKAMEHACPATGGVNPVFIEVGEDEKGLTLRSINQVTKQHTIGAIVTLRTKGVWLPRDEWEQEVFDAPSVEKKKSRPRRIK